MTRHDTMRFFSFIQEEIAMTDDHVGNVLRRAAPVLVLVSVVVFLGGCVSIVGGARQALRVETEPAGAEAVTADERRCITPCELLVSEKKGASLRVHKEGFAPVEIPLERRARALRVAAVIAGNLALGIVVGNLVEVEDHSGGFGALGATAVVAASLGLASSAIGIGIDLHNGAHRRLTPQTVRVVLNPAAANLSSGGNVPSPPGEQSERVGSSGEMETELVCVTSQSSSPWRCSVLLPRDAERSRAGARPGS